MVFHKKFFRKWAILGLKIFGYPNNSRKLIFKVFLRDKKDRTVINPIVLLNKRWQNANAPSVCIKFNCWSIAFQCETVEGVTFSKNSMSVSQLLKFKVIKVFTIIFYSSFQKHLLLVDRGNHKYFRFSFQASLEFFQDFNIQTIKCFTA